MRPHSPADSVGVQLDELTTVYGLLASPYGGAYGDLAGLIAGTHLRYLVRVLTDRSAAELGSPASPAGSHHVR